METTTTPAGTKAETRTCPDCEGAGRTEQSFFGGYGECGACSGEGEIDGYRCACGSDETEECECSVETKTDGVLAVRLCCDDAKCSCAAEEAAVKQAVAYCLKRGSHSAAFEDAVLDAASDHGLDDAAHDRVSWAAGDALAKLGDGDWRVAS